MWFQVGMLCFSNIGNAKPFLHSRDRRNANLTKKNLLSLCDCVEKCSADEATPAAGWPKRFSKTIGNFGERLIGAGVDDAGIMELVSAQNIASLAERAGFGNLGLTVTKVHLPLGKAGGV
jgi:hypothetical protein